MKQEIQNIIDNIIAYVKTGEAPDSLNAAQKLLGDEELRLLSLNTLAWLRRKAVLEDYKKLKLDQQYPWCQNMLKFFETCPELKTFATVTETEVAFIDSLSDEEQQEIRAYVRDNYKPRIMVDPRRE